MVAAIDKVEYRHEEGTFGYHLKCEKAIRDAQIQIALDREDLIEIG